MSLEKSKNKFSHLYKNPSFCQIRSVINKSDSLFVIRISTG